MSDERAVEAIADQLKRDLSAAGVLAALRAAGFDVYRPDEAQREWRCVGGMGMCRHVTEKLLERGEPIAEAHKHCGPVDVVPVGGEG